MGTGVTASSGRVGVSSTAFGAAAQRKASSPDIARPIPRRDLDQFADAPGNVAFRASLTEAEQRAVRNYTGADYAIINDVLRGKADSSERARLRGEVAKIDSALNKGRVEKSITVYRGFHSAKRFEYFNNTAKIGDVFRDAGFMSTSVDRKAVRDFVNIKGGQSNVVLRIKVKKGAKAGYLGHDTVSGSSHELELLLPRNSGLRIGKIRRMPRRGLIVVNASLV